MRTTDLLLQVPANLMTTAQRAFYERIAAALPVIPTFNNRANHNLPQIAPCIGGYPPQHVNAGKEGRNEGRKKEREREREREREIIIKK